jgi:hypothetical protein
MLRRRRMGEIYFDDWYNIASLGFACYFYAVHFDLSINYLVPLTEHFALVRQCLSLLFFELRSQNVATTDSLSSCLFNHLELSQCGAAPATFGRLLTLCFWRISVQ